MFHENADGYGGYGGGSYDGGYNGGRGGARGKGTHLRSFFIVSSLQSQTDYCEII